MTIARLRATSTTRRHRAIYLRVGVRAGFIAPERQLVEDYQRNRSPADRAVSCSCDAIPSRHRVVGNPQNLLLECRDPLEIRPDLIEHDRRLIAIAGEDARSAAAQMAPEIPIGSAVSCDAGRAPARRPAHHSSRTRVLGGARPASSSNRATSAATIGSAKPDERLSRYSISGSAN